GPHTARNASTNSLNRGPRARSGTPAASNSSGIHPCPRPATTRPPESRSSVAKRRARSAGLCSRATTMLVPSVIRLVRAAANASTSSGENTESYAAGSGTTSPFIRAPPVGASRRSNVHTESRPTRSAVSATSPIVSGPAAGPVVGRAMPSFTCATVAGKRPPGRVVYQADGARRGGTAAAGPLDPAFGPGGRLDQVRHPLGQAAAGRGARRAPDRRPARRVQDPRPRGAHRADLVRPAHRHPQP